jgi:hypothetical protein
MSQSASRRRRERFVALSVAVLLLLPVVVFAGVLWIPPLAARWRYEPREGDIVFQSLPSSRLSRAIEGATHSRFSHCGIVERDEGRWTVLEAYRGVERTALSEWLARGQEGGFVVYRLKEPFRENVPAMLASAHTHLGKPYDVRYRWDDEKIYCSELVFKAYKQATGESLGRLTPLGELNWKPFTATIEHYEGAPPPLDREMITPRDLARAEQLEEVFRFGL